MRLESGGLSRAARGQLTLFSGPKLPVCHIKRTDLYQHFPNFIQGNTSCRCCWNVLEERVHYGQISWGNILYCISHLETIISVY